MASQGIQVGSKYACSGFSNVAEQVKNQISIHEDVSSILGLTQWVKDLSLPQAAA